ncbi:hypothetical protein ACI7YU_18250 [Pseudomonas siliginis]|uniref:SLAC1 family transporter n=1 Tax=Pseudomonas siliginis TaxID=2842346 RepID=UPI003868F56B
MKALSIQRKLDLKIGAIGNLPMALFGAIMGLSGLSVAWRLASDNMSAPHWIGQCIGYMALLVFAAMAAGYAIKIWSSVDGVRREFMSIFSGDLFGPSIISLLLIPLMVADINLAVDRTVWVLGAVGIAVFAWMILGRWMEIRHHAENITPSWLVPLIGAINVILAIPAPHVHTNYGLMMFCITTALFVVVPLITQIFPQRMFHGRMPPRSRRTFMLVAVPFVVGFSVCLMILGHMNEVAEALIILMLFLLAVMLGRLWNLVTCSPFSLAWWAVSFPLAASSAVAFRYADHAHNVYTDAIAIFLLGFASVVVFGLLVRTLVSIWRHELRPGHLKAEV